MKKFKVLFIAVVILSAGSFIQQAVAQEKTTEEQEKELRLQQLIEEQKKAMIDQKAAKTEADVMMMEHTEEMGDVLRELNVKVDAGARGGSTVGVYSRGGGRQFGMDNSYIFTGTGDAAFFRFPGGEGERTNWDFSKSLKESTFSKEYTFDVEKTAKNVSMSVNGDCKAGEIRINIIMPNGKIYSENLIDEFGNLNLRKTFTITETENTDKTGEWTFKISSVKATGLFRISLQTY